MRLGPFHFEHPVVLAPMAGVTDRPFRALCRRYGADYAVSEMISSDPRLWTTRKTRWRLDHAGETAPLIVQLAGSDPGELASAARASVAAGAQIIDINMGCPVRKICKRMAGSALLKNERLVGRLLEAVVEASAVPVTLKFRTGWDPSTRNGAAIARIAETAGVQALAVHGRTRECAYRGAADYDAIAAIKASVSVPVIANGDITTPARARLVLDRTGADGVMIGRSARGNPWIFREIKAHLQGREAPARSRAEFIETVRGHVSELHEFYGPAIGLRVARKHVRWYLQGVPGGRDLSRVFNTLTSPEAQLGYIDNLPYDYDGVLAA